MALNITGLLQHERVMLTEDFITRNDLKLRTSAEVFERLVSFFDADMLGFKTEVLASYVSYADIKPYLTEERVQKIDSGENEYIQITDVRECAQDFLDYMVFAWGKAEDMRGLSAGRSIEKLSMWLWLMNQDELAEEIQKEELFYPYGAPALIAVCKKMGIETPESLHLFVLNYVEPDTAA